MIDKFDERVVSTEEGERLAEKLGCRYVETSAKSGISVQKIFFDLVRMLRGSKSTRVNPAALPSSEVTKIRPKEKHCLIM